MPDVTALVTELHAEGLVRLHAGFDPGAAGQMRARVWRELAADGSTEAFWSKEVVTAVDGLLGKGCWERPPVSELLLTFPEPDEPLRQLDPFHSDFALDVADVPLFGLELFSFIAALPPRSGGTLVLRSSHRVVKRFLDSLRPGFPRNRAAAQFVADNPWLRTLEGPDGPIGATHDADGIEVVVEELTGEPGDVVITHPWTFHAGISSRGTTPRMMLRHRILRTAS